MAEYRPKATLPSDLDAFTRAYLECAEWSGVDSEQEEAFELSVAPKWDDASIKQAREDCDAFQSAHSADIESDLSQAGHDFWLTRNHHGAGFWDGDWPDEVGKRLTDDSHAYGSVNVWYDEQTETLSMS